MKHELRLRHMMMKINYDLSAPTKRPKCLSSLILSPTGRPRDRLNERRDPSTANHATTARWLLFSLISFENENRRASVEALTRFIAVHKPYS